MMLRLMRRESVWPMIPYLAAASLLMTAWASLGGKPQAAAVSAVYVSISAGLLTVARTWQRSTLFEAALPIDGRALLLARLLTLLLYIWVPIATSLLVALGFWNAGRGELWQNLTALGAAMSLFIVVMQTVRLPVMDTKKPDGAGVALVVLGVVGLALWAKQPWIVTAFCVPAAVVWGAVKWPREAFTFQCAPGEAGTAARKTEGGPASGIGWLVVLKAFFPWQGLIWLGFAALFPLVDNVFFPMFYSFAYLEKATPGMNWMLTLPVPRKKILAILVGAYLSVLAASFLGGINYGLTSRYSAMGSNRSSTDRLGIPFHYWQAARGPLETITAPSGETLRTPSKRVFQMDFYNPYAVGEESTPAFRQWQYRRAAVQIYGAENIQGLKPLMLSFRMQFLMVLSLACLTMVVFALGLLPRWSRFNRLPPMLVKGLPQCLLLAFLGVLAVVPVSIKVEHGSAVMLEIFAAWISGMLPENPVAMAVVGLGGVSLIAAMLAKMFDEVEFTGQSAWK